MPEQSPFDDYLRQINARLSGLPPARREQIGRELLAHLADAAAEQAADPADPAVQSGVIARLGPAAELAQTYAAVHGAASPGLAQLAALAGIAGGFLGTIGALAYLEYGWLGVPLTLLLVLAGSIGLAGGAQRYRAQPAWLGLINGGVLLAAGLPVLYRHHYAADRLLGLALTVGGELLLCAAATAPLFLRMPRRRLLAGLGAALLLVSFVSPFSYLPNPLGMYYFFFGGYRFDPNTPLVNRFATQGVDNTGLAGAKLGRLIGQTGLDPLDPNSPLASYRIVSETAASFLTDGSVDVELRYADGTARRSTITVTPGGVGISYTSIDTLFAPHLELPGLPFAAADAPLQFAEPERLPIEASDRWARAPSWSPDRRRFFYFATEPDEQMATLWVATIATGETQRIALGAVSPLWSADSRAIIYVVVQGDDRAQNSILVHEIEGAAERFVGTTDRRAVAAAGSMVYFLSDGGLWRVALGGGRAERLRALPNAGLPYDDQSPLVVDPTGQHVAYRCGNDTCVAGTTGARVMRVGQGFSLPATERPVTAVEATPGPVPTSLPAELSPPQFGSLGLAWSPDGQRLAAIVGAWDYGTPQIAPVLRIITPDGQVERQLALGPNGLADAPQWSPDGRRLLINTMPEHGRRIVAVDVATGAIFDLSRPRWDAFAQLSPDGRSLLLWNGRGGFWRAAVLARP